MTEFRNPGAQDILIAVAGGLKSFPEAINAAFPETTMQTCIFHLVHHSLTFVRREQCVSRCFLIFLAWKDHKAVSAKLRDI